MAVLKTCRDDEVFTISDIAIAFVVIFKWESPAVAEELTAEIDLTLRLAMMNFGRKRDSS